MAQWELSPAFMKVQRRLGNMVFYELKGRIHARKRPERRKKDSPAQAEVIEAFKKLIGDWRCLDGLMRESWRAAARAHPKHGSGYTLFMGTNLPHRRRGEPLELSMTMGEDTPPRFLARPGHAPGEILCEFACADSPAGRHMSFFIQKREDGLPSGELARIEGGMETGSPFTLGGLDPCCEYFVYAVVTGKAYTESSTVSASQCAICRAAR